MFIKRNIWEQLTNENCRLRTEKKTAELDNQKLKETLEETDRRRKLFEDAFYNGLENMLEVCYVPKPVIPEDPNVPKMLFQTVITDIVPDEIEKVLSEMDMSFSDRVMELIREKGLNEVEVYKKADLDRRLFSKLRSDSEYRPTKDTAILLCMSMELTYDETVDLLSRAGLAFSKHSKIDLIAQFFFRKNLYDVPLYKEVLYKYGLLKEW